MARREAFLEVTQPYHGPDGEVLFDVGYRFGPGDDLPEGIRTAPVVEESEGAPAGKARAPKAKPPAPEAPAGNGA